MGQRGRAQDGATGWYEAVCMPAAWGGVCGGARRHVKMGDSHGMGGCCFKNMMSFS